MIPDNQLNHDQPIRRILVIRSGGLGDFVLILPVLTVLREKWTSAQLELLTHPEMGELAGISGLVDRIHSIDAASTAALFSNVPLSNQSHGPLQRLLGDCDLVINFLPDSDGFLEDRLGRFAPLVLTVPPPVENSIHASSQFLLELERLGISIEEDIPDLNLSLPKETLTLPLESSSIAIHPGSGSRRKNWNARGFARIASWIQESTSYDTVLITGEADGDSRTRFLNELGGQCSYELHNASLLEVVSVLQHCRLLIGNDSGISHLAAAVGTPVLAFFGPTSPEVWRPLGETVKVITFAEASFERIKREIHALL